MITVHTFVFNHFSQNTYLLYDQTGQAALVDPGCYFAQEKQQVLDFLKQENLTLSMVLFTHCHLDHAFGAKFIRDQFPEIPFYAHENELVFITDGLQHAARYGLTMEQPPALTGFVKHGDTIKLGASELKALFVPGHSPGSICYYSAESGFVIVGDVLFCGSIGRTDLLGGNMEQLLEGISKHLLTLPAATVVYSGHGETTTIDTEASCNPYLARIR